MATEGKAGTVYMELDLDTNKYDKGIKNASNRAENAFASSMKKIGGFIAGAFAVKEIVGFGKAAVDEATKIQSAWTGLNSIATGTGKSFGAAQEFITDYTKDGLVSVTEAVTAYKNLLSRGYDTSQIENTMNALKDSASFGRQASYGLGEAVMTATEGLKNENSILVDNAGVTKNVAKMWEDWAKAHGTTTNAMTQAQKIEAEYNGILEETKFQTGDAATYTKTFGGQMQQLKMTFTNLKVAVGQVVAPLASLFIPVINGALVAVTNFFNGIKQVLSVFGLSFPNVVSKTSAGIQSVGQSATDTASDIASTGGAAKKAAKEIKNAFAGIDELHTIDTDTSSSSGSSGSSTPDTGVEIQPVVASDNSISNAISGTMEKIMKYIEPLKSIKFDNLINAFDNLKNAISPIIQTIGDILSWLYFNILVPLAKWSIEDAVPAFFNLLAGAFKILNPVLISFKDLGIWLWENFLQPIASWTGGIIVDVLNSTADVLSKIGDWMSKNQPIVDAITFSVVGFFGAWKIIELVSFIQQAGGVIAVLKTMGTAIWAVTGAKIADKIETIAITALYAKDFVVSIAKGTAALVKNVVQFGLTTAAKATDIAITIASTAATTAATAATWLFNAALLVLTSPITLVVLAIGALIAIVVLLIKHWDDVKIAASNCWEKIKEVWQVVSNWFNQNIIQPISNFFSGLWNGLKDGASNAWNGIKSIWNSVSSWFDSKIIQPIKNLFSSLSSAISNSFKAPINFIIDGINTFLRGINKIKVPDWVPGVGGKGFNFKTIPRLAQGGYVEKNNPQLAIIGDNTREGEIVTPESKIYEQVVKGIKDAQIGLNQNVAVDLKLEPVKVEIEGDKLVIILDRAKNDKGYNGGKNPSFMY